MKAVAVSIAGQPEKSVPVGTSLGDVLPSRCDNGEKPIAAILNNMAVPLETPLLLDCTLEPLSFSDPIGYEVWRNSLCFLFAKSAWDLFPERECRIRCALGGGFYCTLTAQDGKEVSPEEVAALESAMLEAVSQDLPITTYTVPYQSAVEKFKETGQRDKLNLLEHRNPPFVLMTKCGDFSGISQKPLVPSTGALATFALTPFGDGMLLRMPARERPGELPELPESEPLYEVYREHIAWGRTLGVTTVGDLNEAIVEHKAEDFVRTAEARHNRDLAKIAEKIAARKNVRLVLVAGPSSAGKTTFATRLCTWLRVNGLRPMLLSTDDYFVGDARNPRDEDGKLDYEHLDAVDRPRLNSDLARLLNGEAVHMRKFDFAAHDGFDREDETKLEENGVVVMEGIHSLNPELVPGVPDDKKFLVFLNTLTQLGVDSCTRIASTDTRILRRLVRDYRYRKRNPAETLRMWASVARGERRWIYPFQGNADAIFNSALDYEMAVLKPMASILLNQIKPWEREYIEARRLSGILHNFSILAPDVVPGDSILRETIGGSQLSY